METRLQSLSAFLKEKPLNIILWKLYCKLFTVNIPRAESWITLIKNKSGIEIGGPSRIFSTKNFLPLYPFVKSLDGVNFSDKTIWEGELQQGNNYHYEGKTGFQFIAEGTELKEIKDDHYDFLLSSNNLEHIANPIKALFEWKRIIKPGGIIILVLPKKESNFDHNRSITSFQHLQQDFENNTRENDLTHLNEILQLHDLKRDSHAGSFADFKKRALNNFETRSLHHHVFDVVLLKQLIEFVEMKTELFYSSPTDHFIAARK
ncbi:MAG TPA: methyltransferase domain-containing protein [Hanamia sp.]|nr:methyltransferase domain-containing protein [Hanamia sp.]